MKKMKRIMTVKVVLNLFDFLLVLEKLLSELVCNSLFPVDRDPFTHTLQTDTDTKIFMFAC